MGIFRFSESKCCLLKTHLGSLGLAIESPRAIVAFQRKKRKQQAKIVMQKTRTRAARPHGLRAAAKKSCPNGCFVDLARHAVWLLRSDRQAGLRCEMGRDFADKALGTVRGRRGIVLGRQRSLATSEAEQSSNQPSGSCLQQRVESHSRTPCFWRYILLRRKSGVRDSGTRSPVFEFAPLRKWTHARNG